MWKAVGFDAVNRKARIPECHPNRPHASKGLCDTCYHRVWYQANKQRAMNTAMRHYWKNVDSKRKEAREKYHSNYLGRKDKNWANKLKNKFGITPDDFNLMLSKQDNLCAICANPERGSKRLSIDHNHTTGKVRGLLCTSCNTTLEALENIEWRTKAEVYLKENE